MSDRGWKGWGRLFEEHEDGSVRLHGRAEEPHHLAVGGLGVNEQIEAHGEAVAFLGEDLGSFFPGFDFKGEVAQALIVVDFVGGQDEDAFAAGFEMEFPGPAEAVFSISPLVSGEERSAEEFVGWGRFDSDALLGFDGHEECVEFSDLLDGQVGVDGDGDEGIVSGLDEFIAGGQDMDEGRSFVELSSRGIFEDVLLAEFGF